MSQQIAWRQPPLTQDEQDELFMLLLEDDAEDAPWMVMGDLQFWSASGFAHSLRAHARRQGLPWYVAAMLPIEYRWPAGDCGRHILAPDTFVAFVPDHPRTSYHLVAEGQFPPFVLEVVSPSSVERDEQEKRRAYELLGAREYALFTPRVGQPSMLAGWRRGADGLFEPWHAAADGRLWSDVLALDLVVRGTLLQAQMADGTLLLSPEQEAAARLGEVLARERAEEARERAEREVERLRRALARYRAPEGTGDR